MNTPQLSLLEKNPLLKRVWKCFMEAYPKALKTSLWLLKIMVPVTFAVVIMNYTGILAWVSAFVAPLFEYIGLPGESAFVLITSIFTNVYSAIAVITTLGFGLREATLLALMCLISHGFIIESAVVKKTGSNLFRMLLVRLISSFVAAILINLILPEMQGRVGLQTELVDLSLTEMIKNWASNTFFLMMKIVFLVTALMFLQKLLEEFGVIKSLYRPLRPIMKIMGLPENTSLSWIAANTLGLAYGAAIIIDEVEQGHMSKEDADLLNHHIVVSHSQLEDPLLFAAIGIPMFWIIWPRIVFAIIAVWLRKLEMMIRKKPNQI
ncbi:MAG: nucleoside recognition domain-containing protein [Bacteroidales bacterium]|nr:nucleoside recognition domain-containing protein [Bacteroidales bacterium]